MVNAQAICRRGAEVEGHPHGRLGAQSKDSLSAILPRWDGEMIRGVHSWHLANQWRRNE